MSDSLTDFQQQLDTISADAIEIGETRERARIVAMLSERAAPHGSDVCRVLTEIIAALCPAGETP